MLLLITALFVPLFAIAKEEQNDMVIFQQYKQNTVKPYNYSYNSSFMNYMIMPYHYRGYRHGFSYIGYDNWYDYQKETEYLLKDMPKDTLTDPKEYPTNLEERLNP